MNSVVPQIYIFLKLFYQTSSAFCLYLLCLSNSKFLEVADHALLRGFPALCTICTLKSYLDDGIVLI